MNNIAEKALELVDKIIDLLSKETSEYRGPWLRDVAGELAKTAKIATPRYTIGIDPGRPGTDRSVVPSSDMIVPSSAPMLHPDPGVRHAIVKLNDALCSYERATTRESILIIREAGGFVHRSTSGKPTTLEISDELLLASVQGED